MSFSVTLLHMYVELYLTYITELNKHYIYYEIPLGPLNKQKYTVKC